MADIGASIKGIWLKGMEAIGNTASNIATNTKSKVDEMNLVNRRAEILKDFGNKAYALWLKGEHFPEELDAQLQELQKLDNQLNDLRAERLAGVKTEKDGSAEAVKETENTLEAAAESVTETASEVAETAEGAAYAAKEAIKDAAEATEESMEDTVEAVEEAVPVIRVETPAPAEKPITDMSSAINDLFDKVPSAEEAADKVNSALDSLQDGLKQFSDRIDDQIADLADQLDGGKPEE